MINCFAVIKDGFMKIIQKVEKIIPKKKKHTIVLKVLIFDLFLGIIAGSIT